MSDVLAVPPTVDDLVDWLGGAAAVTIDPVVGQLAIDRATSEQAQTCVVDPYTVSLRGAALRRAARVLAARRAPLGALDLGDLGGGFLPRWDQEIETAEASRRMGAFA